MNFIYNIFVQLYRLGIYVASFFNSKAKLAVSGRQDWKKKLRKKIQPDESWIWMHCSSLGEFEQGRPVFEKLKKNYPDHKFALSFFSPSGFEIRKNYPLADLVFYLPFDTPENAKTLAQILQPKLWVLVKYDYWYNHLKYQHASGTKITVISAIFRENQPYFKSYGKWFSQNLKKYISYFFVQDKSSEDLLNSIGIAHVTISGDTRFDRVKSIASRTEELKWVKDFKTNHALMVVGSSWKDDEVLWAKFINEKLPENWKVMIVPHEIKTEKILTLQKAILKKTILFSELQNVNKQLADYDVVIVDAIGLLSKIYASAEIAYVGGGFNKSGVHNTLEPAVFGVPVVIGPNFEKFNEVKLLKEKGILFSINDYEAFEKILFSLIYYPEKRNDLKIKAKQFFDEQLPSTEIIVDSLTFLS